MNDLTVINRNGQLVIDSREVAEALEIRHDHLLAKIKGYCEILTTQKIGALDFFIESTYIDNKGEERPCYLLTKKGCDMVANKMTGEKGVIFTAKYVTKFEEMEKQIKNELNKNTLSTEDKLKLSEAKYNNSLVRKANILLKLAEKEEISPTYRQILYTYATEIVAGKPLLPLPELTEETLSAEQVGKILGISANMVGRIAKVHNLKTEQYGKWFHDKSRYSNKEVQSFRYYESVIPVIKAILSREVLS